MRHIDRITHKEHFVDRPCDFFGQIRDFPHRDAVDAGFLGHIRTCGVLRHDSAAVIGQRDNIPVAGKRADCFNQIRRERILHQGITGLAVNNFTAVITQNTAAALVQFEFPGQRFNANGRPAACQYDTNAPVSGGNQSRLGTGRDNFSFIGKGSVQVKRQNFIFHNHPLFLPVFSYCTRKYRIAQGSDRGKLSGRIKSIPNVCGLAQNCAIGRIPPAAFVPARS